MAVTIVGVNTASTAGAVNITIPLPAGVAIGDEVVLWLKYKRAAGTTTSVTTPSGWAKVGGNNGEGVTLFQQLFTTTPPANVVVTFANSDTHCRAQSVAWRGAFNDGGGSTIRQTIITQIAAVSGANTLTAQYVQYPNSLLLSLYATAGASVTIPITQTGLAASTQVGPPALGVASGYELVATPGAITAESATLSAATTLVLVQCEIIPADAVNGFVPFLDTPLGPYPAYSTTGYVVFDTTGDYAYHFGQDATISPATVVIHKIQRSTFTVVATVTLTGHSSAYTRSIAQDDTALYLSHAVSEYPNESYFKILKSDLSIVHSGAHATDTTLTHHIRLGKTGTWSAGLLFSVMWDISTSAKYLVAWDTTSGSVSSRTTIPYIYIDPGTPPDTGALYAWDQLQVDNNGDLWLYSVRQSPSIAGDQLVLTKITSGVTFNTPIHISTVLAKAITTTGLIYDPGTHALILTTNNDGNFVSRPSIVARYDIATSTIVYQSTYPPGLNLTAWNPGGIGLMQQYSQMSEGNSLRNFQGVPSIFIGWWVQTTANGESWPERRRLITQYNHLTGALIRVFELPSTLGLPETYGPVMHILQSPENELWFTSVDIHDNGAANNEYIHKLDLAGAIIASESAQGWVSWSEMQVPPAQTAFHRPSYGRGYGLGYGGAGPYMHPGAGDQFARPSVDTLIGTYTDAAAGVTNIYQSIDEPTVNDADYITSVSAPSNAVYVTKLTTLTDPLISTGHIVRYRYKKDGGASVQLDLVMQLRQGYVNEGTLGTLIKEWIHTDISTTLTTASQTLTGGEADTITDYTLLFKRFRFNQV